MANIHDGMLMAMAHLAPHELLISLLEEVIKDYQEAKLLNKSEKELKELFEKFGLPCLTILIKIRSEDISLFDMMDELEKVSRARTLLDPEKG